MFDRCADYGGMNIYLRLVPRYIFQIPATSLISSTREKLATPLWFVFPLCGLATVVS